jgi:predicted transcriptional regulator
MLTGLRLKKRVAPLATTFRAAGNTTRLAMLSMIAREPITLARIVSRLKISPSLAIHHLNMLHRAGWVTKTKFGKLVTYYLVEGALKDTGALLKKRYS